MRIDAEFRFEMRAGAAQIEITPPLQVGILMSSVDGEWAPFEGVRTPLKAQVILLESHDASSTNTVRQRVAIVSLDLLTLTGRAVGGFQHFKSQICSAAGDLISPENLVLVCTHSHSAPESGGLTDLYLTEEFKDWKEHLERKIGIAIAKACRTAVPCSVACGSTVVPNLGIHRRFKTKHGIMMSHPVPPAELILSRDGAVDDSVNVATVCDMNGEMIAVLVNATCHPVYEMCCPMISADFPGELVSELESIFPGTQPVFLNGAAGNINPQGVSAGPEAAQAHGQRLALAVKEVIEKSLVPQAGEMSFRRRNLRLPARLPDGRDVGETIQTEISALRLGKTAFVFIPGEPFAEIGLAIRAESPFPLTSIIGFAENSIGYIPTDEAFDEGGYEVGFGQWSYLGVGSADLVCREAIRLLKELGLEIGLTTGSIAAPHFRERKRKSTRIS